MPDKILAQEAEHISEEDVIEGMRELRGYFDITPRDFKELYTTVDAFAKKRLMREVTARTIMTQPVFTINAWDSIETLIALLAEKNISGVPVLGNDPAQGKSGGPGQDTPGTGNLRIVGVVSEKDILALLGKRPDAHLMLLVADAAKRPWSVSPEDLREPVSEIMNIPALTVNEDSSLGELTRIFQKKNINRVPVVDKNGSPLGIITRSDMISAISRLL